MEMSLSWRYKMSARRGGTHKITTFCRRPFIVALLVAMILTAISATAASTNRWTPLVRHNVRIAADGSTYIPADAKPWNAD